MTFLRKVIAMSCSLALCLTMAACASKKGERLPAPSQGGKPILPGTTQTDPSPNDYTAVYVTVFEDLAIIASYPVLQNPNPDADPEKLEPECDPRELSDGGNILCGGAHEQQRPITRVLIADQVVPKSMAGWFRDMVHLQQIDGLEKIRTHHVTDMNHLFAGCGKLAEVNIEAWDVSDVADMTGMFEDCSALFNLPTWYHQGDNDSLG